ncbi:hypothetical protein GCM10010417_31480 [Streptomyces carpaticus]
MGYAAKEVKSIRDGRIGLGATQDLQSSHRPVGTHGSQPPHIFLAPLASLLVVVIFQDIQEEFTSGVCGETLKALAQLKVFMKDCLLGHIFQGIDQRSAFSIVSPVTPHHVQDRIDAFQDTRVPSESPCFLDHLPEREAGAKLCHASHLRTRH